MRDQRHAGTLAAFATLTLAVPVVHVAAQGYDFVNIADTSGPFAGFRPDRPWINDEGTVAFRAVLDPPGGSGIFTGSGGQITTIWTGNAGRPSINDAGTVAFTTSSEGGYRILAGNGGPISTLYSSECCSDGFYGFGNVAINNGGTLAFHAGLRDGDTGDRLIVTGSGGATTTITQENGPPVALILNNHFAPSINDGGTVAFYALLDAGGQGVFTGSGGAATMIADSSGPFVEFGVPSINDAGDVAFDARYEGGHGIFIVTGGVLTTVADSSGPFGWFNDPAINAAGDVVFPAMFDDGFQWGLFTGDDPSEDTVLLVGDALFGSTVTSLGISPGALNDHGDIAFWYELESGVRGIAVAAAHRCMCEIDGETGQVNVFDLLAYLDLWFAADPDANIDGADAVDVFDLLAFLDCWFPASSQGACL